MSEIKADALSRLELIEKLAGANYGPRDIAVYLGENVAWFLNEWQERDSATRQSYDRGVLMVQADIDMQIAENARGGNITAAQLHKKSAQERAWANAFNPEGDE